MNSTNLTSGASATRDTQTTNTTTTTDTTGVPGAPGAHAVNVNRTILSRDPRPLPHGWREQFDPVTERYYYVNPYIGIDNPSSMSTIHPADLPDDYPAWPPPRSLNNRRSWDSDETLHSRTAIPDRGSGHLEPVQELDETEQKPGNSDGPYADLYGPGTAGFTSVTERVRMIQDTIKDMKDMKLAATKNTTTQPTKPIHDNIKPTQHVNNTSSVGSRPSGTPQLLRTQSSTATPRISHAIEIKVPPPGWQDPEIPHDEPPAHPDINTAAPQPQRAVPTNPNVGPRAHPAISIMEQHRAESAAMPAPLDRSRPFSSIDLINARTPEEVKVNGGSAGPNRTVPSLFDFTRPAPRPPAPLQGNVQRTGVDTQVFEQGRSCAPPAPAGTHMAGLNTANNNMSMRPTPTQSPQPAFVNQTFPVPPQPQTPIQRPTTTPLRLNNNTPVQQIQHFERSPYDQQLQPAVHQRPAVANIPGNNVSQQHIPFNGNMHGSNPRPSVSGINVSNPQPALNQRPTAVNIPGSSLPGPHVPFTGNMHGSSSQPNVSNNNPSNNNFSNNNVSNNNHGQQRCQSMTDFSHPRIQRAANQYIQLGQPGSSHPAANNSHPRNFAVEGSQRQTSQVAKQQQPTSFQQTASYPNIQRPATAVGFSHNVRSLYREVVLHKDHPQQTTPSHRGGHQPSTVTRQPPMASSFRTHAHHTHLGPATGIVNQDGTTEYYYANRQMTPSIWGGNRTFVHTQQPPTASRRHFRRNNFQQRVGSGYNQHADRRTPAAQRIQRPPTGSSYHIPNMQQGAGSVHNQHTDRRTSADNLGLHGRQDSAQPIGGNIQRPATSLSRVDRLTTVTQDPIQRSPSVKSHQSGLAGQTHATLQISEPTPVKGIQPLSTIQENESAVPKTVLGKSTTPLSSDIDPPGSKLPPPLETAEAGAQSRFRRFLHLHKPSPAERAAKQQLRTTTDQLKAHEREQRNLRKYEEKLEACNRARMMSEKLEQQQRDALQNVRELEQQRQMPGMGNGVFDQGWFQQQLAAGTLMDGANKPSGQMDGANNKPLGQMGGDMRPLVTASCSTSDSCSTTGIAAYTTGHLADCIAACTGTGTHAGSTACSTARAAAAAPGHRSYAAGTTTGPSTSSATSTGADTTATDTGAHIYSQLSATAGSCAASSGCPPGPGIYYRSGFLHRGAAGCTATSTSDIYSASTGSCDIYSGAGIYSSPAAADYAAATATVYTATTDCSPASCRFLDTVCAAESSAVYLRPICPCTGRACTGSYATVSGTSCRSSGTSAGTTGNSCGSGTRYVYYAC
ncbi:hypothetical protein ABW21_db0206147 [Orbilia brochopaga]|nr:hypothetical protein ABW21_db0206147 [Drechslerella brochopaga]